MWIHWRWLYKMQRELPAEKIEIIESNILRFDVTPLRFEIRPTQDTVPILKQYGLGFETKWKAMEAVAI